MQVKWKTKDKNILIYGLGLTGRSAIRVLSKEGANLFLYLDGKLSEDDRDFLSSYPDIKIKEEGRDSGEKAGIERVYDSIKDIFACDISFILRSSGIRLDKEILKLADREKIPYYSDLELAYRLFGGERMIAITGSNGKTTTTSLLDHILRMANRKSVACGNIGIPLLDKMYEGDEETYYIVESSSFQLAKIYEFIPHRAAILNISQDHLEWHHGFKAYREAKFNIARQQGSEDKLWLNIKSPADRESLEEINEFKGRKIIIDPDKISDFNKSINESLERLPGRHNFENALFASSIALDLGLNMDEIIGGLKSFKAIAHRMEIVDNMGGVEFINDSKATNVDSTVRALEGLKGPVILIAGGYNKEVSFEDFYSALKAVKALLLIGETGHQIAEGARRSSFKGQIIECGKLDDAFDKAVKLSVPGDTILLSPASASWDQFKNFEERGDFFRSKVEDLKKSLKQ